MPAILRLIIALATYEREPDKVEATEAGLRDALFGPAPAVFVHMAEADGRVAGFALWFLTFSTWTGRHGLYLEDLFVEERARRRGVAGALFAALGREAAARGAARLDWQVLDWNESAKDFYRRLGAHRKADWEPWRLEGEALARLGGEDRPAVNPPSPRALRLRSGEP